MRNPENETELTKPKNVTVIKLDVTNPEQISEVVNQVTAEYSVDVVLNNAGYGVVGILELSLREIFQRDELGTFST
ncbi:SDR family NAD(P)-dependent oxidoreductase [Chryseobacterium sp. FH2]|uniref:SDR family NAD(P)-dependent oxidoreductase n=1 Tax=Chryseobacterium sp. FH2 TaxID=1674291 RepID=UPI00069F8B76|nr:SDR family NAD(P)-dependent oxidoreductase [Chryseobacterium sp. FH2]